jgi:hypothetical protein
LIERKDIKYGHLEPPKVIQSELVNIKRSESERFASFNL